MKRTLVIATAVATALMLSGCTEIGAISEQTQIDVALNGLVGTLESDHGVTAVVSKQMDVDYNFTVHVAIDAREVDAANRGEVITLVDEALGGGAFDSATTWFQIGDDVLPLYSQNVFGLETLESDLEYWTAIEQEVGAVSFSISSDPDGNGPLTRTRGVHRETVIDYTALTGIPLDETALDAWGSLGVSAMGSVPSAEATAVLAELTPRIPPQDYTEPEAPLALALDWVSEPEVANWYLTSSSLQYDMDDATSLELTDPAASADWPIAVEAASRIAGSGIRASLFAYFNAQNLGGAVWLGECGTQTESNAIDEALFTALQSAGVVMPAGSAPGWCSGG
jgi:hypothetical protein